MLIYLYYLFVLQVLFSLQRWLSQFQTDDLKQRRCILQKSVDQALDIKGRILLKVFGQNPSWPCHSTYCCWSFLGGQMSSIHLFPHKVFSFISHHFTSLSAIHWSPQVPSWHPYVTHNCKNPDIKYHLILRFQLDMPVGGFNQNRTGEFSLFRVQSYCLS